MGFSNGKMGSFGLGVFILGFAAILFSAVYIADHKPGGAATAAPAGIAAPMPKFETSPREHGIVVRNEGSNVLGFFWVTFERDDDKVPITGLARGPIMLGNRAYLAEAVVSLSPGAMPSRVAIVLPGDVPRSR